MNASNVQVVVAHRYLSNAPNAADRGRLKFVIDPDGVRHSWTYDFVVNPYLGTTSPAGSNDWNYEEYTKGNSDETRGQLLKCWYDPIGNTFSKVSHGFSSNCL